MTIKKEELRKIRINEYYDGSGKYLVKAYFHCWALVPQNIADGGVIAQTVAIIEGINGIVEKINPERIQFVDDF